MPCESHCEDEVFDIKGARFILNTRRNNFDSLTGSRVVVQGCTLNFRTSPNVQVEVIGMGFQPIGHLGIVDNVRNIFYLQWCHSNLKLQMAPSRGLGLLPPGPLSDFL
jgi:hypothetical protein